VARAAPFSGLRLVLLLALLVGVVELGEDLLFRLELAVGPVLVALLALSNPVVTFVPDGVVKHALSPFSLESMVRGRG
jgi:hypothetical protein